MNKLTILACIFLYFLCELTTIGAPGKNDSKGEVIEFETKPYKAPEVIKPNPRQTVKFCKKYEGSFISYYQKVYKIQNCKRRQVASSTEISKLTKQKTKIHPVEAEVIRNIPTGKKIDDLRPPRDFACNKIEGKYVTFSNVSVYYIENCKKREFPDWTSYIQHSKGKPPGGKTILAMPQNVFFRIKNGKKISSSIDSEYSKQNLSSSKDTIEIIPIDEACLGMNGKYFGYYSKIYKIEKCRKRLILDSSAFVAKNKKILSSLKEISSTKWFSLPDGPPIDSY